MRYAFSKQPADVTNAARLINPPPDQMVDTNSTLPASQPPPIYKKSPRASNSSLFAHSVSSFDICAGDGIGDDLSDIPFTCLLLSSDNLDEDEHLSVHASSLSLGRTCCDDGASSSFVPALPGVREKAAKVQWPVTKRTPLTFPVTLVGHWLGMTLSG
jgi:hypothetical protein